MTHVRAVAILLCMLLSPAVLSAQSIPGWAQLPGPSGGTVRGLLSAGDGSMFAVLPTGFAWSDDEGRNWNEVPASCTLQIATGIDELYAVRGTDLLYSGDRGVTWEADGPDLGPAAQLYLQRTRNGTFLLFAQFDGSGNPDQTVLWRRTSQSGTWMQETVFDGYAGASLTCSNLAVLTLCEGVPWRSTNDGLTWAAVSTGAGSAVFTRILSDGQGITYLLGNELMLRSTDHGISWTEVLAKNGMDKYSSCTVTTSGDIYVEVERYLVSLPHVLHSGDHGDSWDDRPQTTFEMSADFSLLGSSGGTLFANGLRNGMYRSDDGASSWTPSLEGIHHAYVPWLAADGANGVFGLGPFNSYSSTDRGQTWRTTPLPWQESVTFASDFGITTTGSLFFRQNVNSWVSTDAGATWQGKPVSGPLCAGPEGSLFIALSDGIYRSDDLLTTTVKLRAGSAEKLYWSPGVLIGLRTNGGVHVSLDTGKTFVLQQAPSQSSRGEPQGFILTSRGTMLADFGPNQDQQLNRSTDLGETWQVVGVPGTVEHMVQTSDGYLYALCEIMAFPNMYLGILVSRDDGLTWKAWNNGLPVPGITALTASGLGPVFVGTVSNSVYANTGPMVSAGQIPVRPEGMTLAKAFPLPATEHLEIELHGVSGPQTRLELVDMLGRQLANWQLWTDSSARAIGSLALQTVPPGAYLLLCSDGNASLAVPIIKR